MVKNHKVVFLVVLDHCVILTFTLLCNFGFLQFMNLRYLFKEESSNATFQMVRRPTVDATCLTVASPSTRVSDPTFGSLGPTINAIVVVVLEVESPVLRLPRQTKEKPMGTFPDPSFIFHQHQIRISIIRGSQWSILTY